MSTRQDHGPSRPERERPLERRLFGWILLTTLVPALAILGAGGWLLAESLDIAGGLGPWEEVGRSGREVIRLAEPVADPALATALEAHRAALSESLTQARRWGFIGTQLLETLPWLVFAVALVLAGVAALVARRLARQLAHPIEELVVVAEHLGREEPLPPPLRGSVREVRVLDDALRDAAGKVRDARERAVAAERLRVWGEMARRVAHEMKNPLTPLRFAAHRLVRSPEAPAVAEAAEVIEEEVGRLEELASQFSSLGRPPEGPPTEVDLAELLSSLAENDVPAGVEVRLDLSPGLPPVQAHYDSLFRAFRNLLRNGVEAMEAVPDPRLDIRLERVSDGPWLDVRIADNGVGLPPGEGERIFEPDFTTKTRGTGLGLALVRQAVTSDGGAIRVNRLDPGTEFVVRLPLENTNDRQHEGETA